MTNEELDDVAMLERVLMFLDQVHGFATRVSDTALESTGLTLHHASLIHRLGAAGGRATVSELADALQRASHTVTRRLDALERDGLVVRARFGTGDRRKVLVRLTAKGAKKLTELRSSWTAVLVAAISDATTLKDLFKKMGELAELLHF